MRLVSKSRACVVSKISISLILLIVVSLFVLTIYLLRYLQVMRMRQFMLQSKKISYIFTATSSSKVVNNKNQIQTAQAKIGLPLEVSIRPGDTLEVIGSVDAKLQPLKSERITLISHSIRFIRQYHRYGIPSIYDLLIFLERTPQVLGENLYRYLETSQASLLAGMVFGGTEKQPKSLLEDMKNTGLTHITSASGFNVSILIGFSLSIFTRIMNRRNAVILCLITVFSYSVMAGMTPPIIRASLMGSLYLLSLLLGKPYSVLRSLSLAVAIMLIYQPFLIYSVSFLLTVTSTLGVVYASVLFGASSKKASGFRAVRQLLEENLQTTISVILFTTPLTVSFFGSFSLVAPLANSLLLWMVPILTLVGMGFMGLTVVSGSLSHLVALPLTLFLEVFERSVHLFSELPFSTIAVSGPASWGIIIWYLCLVGYLRWRLALNSNDRQETTSRKRVELMS